MHTLLHYGLKVIFILVCGFVMDRGWLALRAGETKKLTGLRLHKFFFVGMGIALILLYSDVQYARLYS